MRGQAVADLEAFVDENGGEEEEDQQDVVRDCEAEEGVECDGADGDGGVDADGAEAESHCCCCVWIQMFCEMLLSRCMFEKRLWHVESIM